jgi:hypothetical protein
MLTCIDNPRLKRCEDLYLVSEMLSFPKGGRNVDWRLMLAKCVGVFVKEEAEGRIRRSTRLKIGRNHGKFMRLVSEPRSGIYSLLYLRYGRVGRPCRLSRALTVEASSAVWDLAICNSALIYADGTERTHQLRPISPHHLSGGPFHTPKFTFSSLCIRARLLAHGRAHPMPLQLYAPGRTLRALAMHCNNIAFRCLLPPQNSRSNHKRSTLHPHCTRERLLFYIMMNLLLSD